MFADRLLSRELLVTWAKAKSMMQGLNTSIIGREAREVDHRSELVVDDQHKGTDTCGFRGTYIAIKEDVKKGVGRSTGSSGTKSDNVACQMSLNLPRCVNSGPQDGMSRPPVVFQFVQSTTQTPSP